VKRLNTLQMPQAIDIHQHLWPEQLLRALSRRSEPPLLARHRTGWTLSVPGEPQQPIDLTEHDPIGRAALVQADGLDLALIAPSTPLGIESLPEGQAEALLNAYHEGVAELPAPFRAWAAVSLAQPDPGALERNLNDGFVGACLPATALTDEAAFASLGAVLETLERREAPLFVHPGPSRGPARGAVPRWWSALTEYVTSMQTAWHAMSVWGRRAHPHLRVCFAMLAGLAPLHRERLAARGGDPVSHPDTFLDTSSYGARAVDAMLREVGAEGLVYGSDRPVILPSDPDLGEAVRISIRERNPARLLSTTTSFSEATAHDPGRLEVAC
jgi:6-methylsalicylate decarboxylase